MGGRGARAGGGGANINAAWRAAFQPIGGAVQVPPIQSGQPVPAITVQQLQNMSDQEFADYLNGLKNTPIDSRMYYNNDWDTQRLIANMPELNRAPEVVDAATFATLPGAAIYRTVNANGKETALDIAARTMTSDMTTIGEGRMGDGFYFHVDKGTSQRVYGRHQGDINRTATMSAKLNSNARVISESQLNAMVDTASPTVRNAIMNMKSGGGWNKSGHMAFALRNGYNVVSSGNIYNIIDRNAATWSGGVEQWA